MDVAINYLAVFASAVAAFVLGFLWFGPVFGKMWLASMGETKESVGARMQGKNMVPTYIIQAVSAVLTAYVIAHFVGLLSIADAMMALQFAFWSWLGLVATAMLGTVLWEGRSWKYYFITSGYYLVTFAVVALILTYWR